MRGTVGILRRNWTCDQAVGADSLMSESGTTAQAKSASVMPSAWPADHWTSSIR